MPTKSPKIAICIPDLRRAGAENQAVQLAESLRSNGADVSIILVYGSTVDYEIHKEIRITKINTINRMNILNTAIEVRRAVKRSGASFVISLTAYPIFLARVACSSLRHVNHISYFVGESIGGGIFRAWAIRFTKRLDQFTVCNAARVKEAVARKRFGLKNRIHVIPAAVGESPVVFNDQKRENNIFCWVSLGRLHPVKGYDVLIQAAKILSDKPSRVEFKIQILGQGPLGPELEDQIRLARLDSDVDLLGYRDDVNHFLRSADGYVCSSRSEGMSISMVEAMLASLPIVSTDVSGVDELLKTPWQESFIVNADNPKMLAQKMENMMQKNFDERAKIGARNCLHARRICSPQSFSNRWLRLLSGYEKPDYHQNSSWSA